MRLSALHRYPLKSGAGERLPLAEVSAMGLRGDRVLMVATPEGRFLTARQVPRLLQVRTALDAGGASLEAPGMAPLRVAFADFVVETPATVWKDGFSALAGTPAADDWCSRYLGQPLRLLYIGAGPGRRQRHDNAAVDVSFADGYPFLLVGSASLADLNDRLERPVAMANFRPNLVVDTTVPYEEDRWKRIHIGAVEFDVASRCSRCVLTTIDPETVIPDPGRQPLLTLSGYRRFEEGACFGVNLVARGEGELREGEAVEVMD